MFDLIASALPEWRAYAWSDFIASALPKCKRMVEFKCWETKVLARAIDKRWPETAGVVSLKVRGQDGTEVFFKIKRRSPLKKLCDVYAQRQGGTANAYRFIFDGNRITETQTPADLQMENDEVIDAMLEQVGFVDFGAWEDSVGLPFLLEPLDRGGCDDRNILLDLQLENIAQTRHQPRNIRISPVELPAFPYELSDGTKIRRPFDPKRPQRAHARNGGIHGAIDGSGSVRGVHTHGRRRL